MPIERLTPKRIHALKAVAREGKTKPEDTDYWDELLPGFGVRVSARTGRKFFFVRYLSPLTNKHRRYKFEPPRVYRRLFALSPASSIRPS
jgi:hypothetical protein